MEKTTLTIIKEALINDKLCAYIGSGFSVSCGFPDWKTFIEPLAKSLNLCIKKETEYMQIAQYFVNMNGRQSLNKIIKDSFFVDKTNLSPNHLLLAKLKLPEIWTTNYDNAIETAYKKLNINYDLKQKKEDLSFGIHKKPQIFKIHGSFNIPNECVVTQSDYEDYYDNKKYFIEALKVSLIQKIFLFIGFSFKDPDIRFILAELRRANIQGRKHYWIVYDNPNLTPYEKNKQKIFIEDLKKNYKIVPNLIKDWEEITKLLEQLNLCKRKRSVFISGALIPPTKTEDNSFLESIAARLIKEGFNIVSGYGLGVGSQIITGALNQIYMEKKNESSSDRLKLHPFPQAIANPQKRKELWTRYRNDMCLEAGIQIILYGCKIDGNRNIVNSPGIQEEFELAKKNNLFIIPVGSTGYKAQEIWDIMNKNKKSFGYNTKNLLNGFKKINDLKIENPNLIDAIIDIIKEVNKQ
jgi:hypothetical protein